MYGRWGSALGGHTDSRDFDAEQAEWEFGGAWMQEEDLDARTEAPLPNSSQPLPHKESGKLWGAGRQLERAAGEGGVDGPEAGFGDRVD